MSARLLLKRMLAAFACALLSATGALAQRIDPALQGVFSRLPAGGTAEVIVTFHGSSAPSAADLDLLRGAGIVGGVTFRALPMVGTVATLEQVTALSRNPRVRSVFHNKRLQYFNHEATQLTGVQRLRADAAMTRLNRGLPVTGKGVGVLINDSGIDAMHPDLKLGENVVQNVWGPVDHRELAATGFQPFVVAEDQPNSDNGGSGHGTHVAGTVGGTGQASAGKQAGVAPGARLIGYGSGATIVVLNSLGGFDYALANQGRYGIRVINNSWGSAGGFDPDDPVNVATRIAVEQRHMVVVFSAGNSGSAPDTHNPYAKAPWVVSVAAGNKNGTLADFSSRGTPGGPKTVTSASGEVITWLDEPTITAPGVGIVSAKASVSDGVPETENAPYYTMMEGTSMSSPHVAGIVALMLEANPLLSPSEVKQILKETATKMPDALPGREYRSFEVGAGYANAYAAVQKAFELSTPFGKPLQGYEVLGRVQSSTLYERTFDYTPASLPGAYKHSFQVAPGTDRIEVDIRFNGVELPAYGNAGNPLLLDVYDPNGNRYVGFDVYFALYGTTRLVVVANNPTPGTWTAEVKALTPLGNEMGNFLTFPDRVHEKISAFFFDPPQLYDIAGHAAQGAIEFALANGFLGLCADGAFCPDLAITRADFARSFTQFGAVRQSLPLGGGSTFGDVSAAEKPFVEAVAAQGAALRDPAFRFPGVMEGIGSSFFPQGRISRAQIARMLVRGVGGEQAALDHTGDVTYLYNGRQYVIADQDEIPAALRGHVHVAINSNMLNVYAEVEQGPYDLQPTLKFYFRPDAPMSRADAAVAISRYHSQYFAR